MVALCEVTLAKKDVQDSVFVKGIFDHVTGIRAKIDIKNGNCIVVPIWEVIQITELVSKEQSRVEKECMIVSTRESSLFTVCEYLNASSRCEREISIPFKEKNVIKDKLYFVKRGDEKRRDYIRCENESRWKKRYDVPMDSIYFNPIDLSTRVTVLGGYTSVRDYTL